MNKVDEQYLDLLLDIKTNGLDKKDRTGVGTKSVFGRQVRLNLAEGFPILTTKRVHFKSIVHELLWFLKGESNIKYLKDNGVSIWNEWADGNGELGPVYGVQWRRWEDNKGNEIDQIKNLIYDLVHNKDSRRHIVSAWNVGQIPNMKLPPCHILSQFYVGDNKLSCMLYQRSCDFYLGGPFNWASYALLAHLIAHVCGYGVGELVWTGGDVHLYNNHHEAAETQLGRKPYDLPKLELNPEIKDIDQFKFDDIKLVNYQSHPSIKAPIAV